MSDNDNVIDFESGKLSQIHKAKALRVEEMRKAFSDARAESSPKPKIKSLKRRRKTTKK